MKSLIEKFFKEQKFKIIFFGGLGGIIFNEPLELKLRVRLSHLACVALNPQW